MRLMRYTFTSEINNHLIFNIMKVTIHKDSIKQKEIVKATIFLTIGMLVLLIKVGNLIVNGL